MSSYASHTSLKFFMIFAIGYAQSLCPLHQKIPVNSGYHGISFSVVKILLPLFALRSLVCSCEVSAVQKKFFKNFLHSCLQVPMAR